jgi:hypothetical protein
MVSAAPSIGSRLLHIAGLTGRMKPGVIRGACLGCVGVRNCVMPARPTPPDLTAATRLAAGEPALLGSERRTDFRSPVEVVRSIRLMLLDDTGYPASPWLVADILDLSCGGMCLLIGDPPGSPFRPHARVRLDVSMHPDFGAPTLAGSVRWFTAAGQQQVVSLGVQFDRELPRLPALAAPGGV